MNSGQELNKFENPTFSNFRSEDKGSTCTISSTLFDCIVTGTAHCCVGETSLRRSLYMSLTFMNHTTTYYRKRISSNSHSYSIPVIVFKYLIRPVPFPRRRFAFMLQLNFRIFFGGSHNNHNFFSEYGRIYGRIDGKGYGSCYALVLSRLFPSSWLVGRRMGPGK